MNFLSNPKIVAFINKSPSNCNILIDIQQGMKNKQTTMDTISKNKNHYHFITKKQKQTQQKPQK